MCSNIKKTFILTLLGQFLIAVTVTASFQASGDGVIWTHLIGQASHRD